MTDLNTLNARLAALRLPPQTEASLAALPASLDRARVDHALRQAESGQPGALAFLQKNLPAAPAPATPPAPPPAPTPPVNPPAPAVPTPAPQAPRPAPVRPAPTAPTAPTARPATTAPPVPPPAPARPAASRTERVQCRVYGSQAALCVETDRTRQDEPTLRVEAALAVAPRTYDWERKLALQLTREELPLVTATLLGLRSHCECKNHGPDHDKGLEIVHQGTRLFVRVFQKDQGVRAVPVGPADSYYLAALGLRQLRQAAPWLTDQGVLAALKLTVQRMAAAPPAGTQAA